MPHRVLCVEDDLQIGRLISARLTAAGYCCDWLQDGAAALRRFGEGGFDLVLLDLMLPSVDGLEVCRRIRSVDPHTPLIMLTARASIRDVVLGLELGADDYITKPFSMQVLMARVQALLRRHGNRNDSTAADVQPIVRGPLTVDPLKHSVTLAGRAVELTAKEFALLALFAAHPGRSFSRGELLDRVWGAEFEGYDHTVNDPANPRFILTVWGVGYRFAEVEALDADSPAP